MNQDEIENFPPLLGDERKSDPPPFIPETGTAEPEEQEQEQQIQMSIYPTPTGVVIDTGHDNALVLAPDDIWRLIGRLVNAATIVNMNAQEEQRKAQEQHERVRRLIESGSNIPNK